MPLLERISGDDDLPGQADVVVIGGGIIGVAAAYYLAKRNISTALVEKGRIGAEQSSRNWGWCRQQNRDEREIPLAQLSLRLWDGLGAEIGRDLGFRRTGIVYTTASEAELDAWAAWGEIGRRHLVEHRMLSGREARDRTPGSTGDWIGGIHCPTDGRAEPGWAAPRLALAARDLGATIHQDCAARGIETAAGRVSAVVTERGVIRTGIVLCAGGAWSSMFCRHHGIRFPQAGVRSTAFATTPAPEVTTGNVYSPDVALRRREDGGYTVGVPGRARLDISPQGVRFAREFLPMFKKRWPLLSVRAGSAFLSGPETLRSWQPDRVSPFERTRILNPPPVDGLVRRGLAELIRLYPQLRDVKVAASWGGFVDATPDSVPVISPVDALPGFYLASGFSGHGFGVAPGAGLLAASLIAGTPTPVNPAPYHLSRLDPKARLDVSDLL